MPPPGFRSLGQDPVPFTGIFGDLKPHAEIAVVGAPKDWHDHNKVAPSFGDKGWWSTTAYNAQHMFSAYSVPNGFVWRLLSSRESYYCAARQTARVRALLAKRYQLAFTYYTSKVRSTANRVC